jgi:uncharacterized Ntn-hydrolase superfamily protein
VTYSIVGRDAETGELGVAVQSQAFNSGAVVPWAWPGVGAVATQSFSDRRYGWRGLELMAEDVTAADALARLRADDELVDLRQVGMMSADGHTSQWTGAHCVPSAGGVAGDDWAAQANLVESPRVWEAMGEAFAETEGHLALRLLRTLDAAEAEGGDWRGRGGAGIVVVPAEGERWERVIDLRVEEGDASLVELRRLVERALGYRAASRAAEGESAAVARRHGLPDLYVLQCELYDAVDTNRPADARRVLGELEALNPRWRDLARSVARRPELEGLAEIVADLDRSEGLEGPG